MQRAEVQKAVIETLAQIQRDSGRPVPDITDATRALDDLEGFDSLNGEEAATALSYRLGVRIDYNPFVDNNDEPLSIADVVDYLLAAVSGGQNNARH